MYPDDVVEVLHKGPPKHSPIEEYESPLLYYRPEQQVHIICDRWHLGEWIYPRILGRSTDADDANLWHIEAFLRSRGALLVHTTLPSFVIAQNVETRGDDLVNMLQTTEIVSGYTSMIKRTQLPLWTYDYIAHNLTFTATGIVTSADAAGRKVADLNPFITYVGPSRPGLLLLGDVRHELRDFVHKVDPRVTIPAGVAFGPARNTSGHYLLSHLPSNVRHISGIANACDVDDAEALWETLGRPATITLGRHAYDVVKKFNPSTGAVPHPQYVKRFHNKFGAQYGRLISDVAIRPRNELSWRPVAPDSSPTLKKVA